MEQLRVMYVAHDSSGNGADRSLLDMVIAIKEYVVPIVVIPKKGKLEDELIQNGIRYYIVPYVSKLKNKSKITNDDEEMQVVNNVWESFKIADIIKEENIDIVHTNSSVCDVGALAAMISRKPHIWHVREFMEEDFSASYLNLEIKEKLFKSASRLITISESVKKSFYNKYGVESTCLSDGINLENYYSKSNNRNNRFILAGRISDGKGQWDAVKAMAIVNNEISASLVIVGDGDTKTIDDLNNFITNNELQQKIKILPFCDDLRGLRDECTFALTTSRMEALGRVTIEAMAAGLVPIGTNTGGTAEIIGNDQTRGFLYSPGNYQELAKAIIKAINMTDTEYFCVIRQCQEYVRDRFDLNKYVHSILKIYEDVEHIKLGKESLIYKDISRKCKEIAAANVSPARTVEALWCMVKISGRSISDYLLKNGVNTVCIYGVGKFGKRVLEEISASAIRIVGMIDKNAQEAFWGSIRMFDEWEGACEADLLIVTPSKYEKQIIDESFAEKEINVVGLSELLHKVVES